MQSLGETLQAIGAGFQGRLGEYNQQRLNQKQLEEARMLERRKAGAKDFVAVKRLLQSGNTQGANRLLESRVKFINEQGEDPKDTLEFMSVLKNDPKQAMNVLSGIEEQAVARGWVSAPQGPKMSIDKERGLQIIEYPNGRVETRPIQGLGPTEADRLSIEKMRAEIRNMGREEATTRMKEARAAGLRPGTKEYRDFLTRDTSTKVNVNNPNEMQTKILYFANLMRQTSKTIDDLEDGLSGEDYFTDTLGEGTISNLIRSPEYQQYKATARQWVDGAFRIKTGAAAPEEEFQREFKKFFPQPGDSASTVEHKRRLRRNEENAMKFASGSMLPDWLPGAGTEPNRRTLPTIETPSIITREVFESYPREKQLEIIQQRESQGG